MHARRVRITIRLTLWLSDEKEVGLMVAEDDLRSIDAVGKDC
jgi:hypothetical protein